MTIDRIESITYGVEDLDTCVRFMDDWGLEQTARTDTSADYRTLENQTLFLRLKDDPDLPETHETVETGREVIWGVDTKESLDALAADLSRDRDVTEDADGTLHTRDDRNFAIGFKVAARQTAQVEKHDLNFHEDIQRVNKAYFREGGAKPIRIGHVVYGVEAEDNMAAAEFYLERLHFWMSDRSTTTGTFMRSDGSDFHHSIFLIHRGDERRFDHLAFEVSGFDELMAGGASMLNKGWETQSGPGRHSLGSNIFWYFRNPCGGAIEYFTDMDRLTDDWEPGMWDDMPPYDQWMIHDALTNR